MPKKEKFIKEPTAQEIADGAAAGTTPVDGAQAELSKDRHAEKAAEYKASKPPGAKKGKRSTPKKKNKVAGYVTDEHRAKPKAGEYMPQPEGGVLYKRAEKWSRLQAKHALGAKYKVPIAETDSDMDQFVADGNATKTTETIGGVDFAVYELDADVEEIED